MRYTASIAWIFELPARSTMEVQLVPLAGLADGETLG
jgi:hypothetical protein